MQNRYIFAELKKPQLAEIPILAMTANAFDEDRKMAYESDMNRFLSKPVQIEELLAPLKNILK